MAECALCNGAGWYLLAVPLGHPQWGELQACACTTAQQRTHREAQARAARDQRLASLRAELGAMAGVTLQTFALNRPIDKPVKWGGATYTVESQRSALHVAWHKVSSYSQGPVGWLYLAGPVGSGKTHLAAAAANALADRYDIVYASAPQLLRYIRAGFQDHTADSRLEAVQLASVLILDDIGAEQLTDWSESLLFDLLNQRYLYQRHTILTSNLHHDALPSRIGSRIAQETGKSGIVLLPVCDYRRLDQPDIRPSMPLPVPAGEAWDRGE